MSDCKMPKHRIINGKKYTLTAGTQHGTDKSHAKHVGENFKSNGHIKSYRVLKCGRSYFTYSR